MKKADLVKAGLFINQANAITGADGLVTSLTALAGGAQSGATALSGIANVISTCATGGDSAQLPAGADVGDEIWVRNEGVAALAVFPQSGGKINNGTADAAVSLQPGATGVFKARTSIDWSFVKSGGSVLSGITAFAGGGQGSATALTGTTNIIATCATLNDSVKLPAGVVAGDEVWVRNNGAASANVFPQTGGAINGGSANAAVALAASKTMAFRSLGSGNWLAILTA